MNKPYISPEQDHLWIEVLCALEAGTLTRAAVLAATGIGRRTLYYRLARARSIRDDIEADEPEDGDPVHLEVVGEHAPRGPGGDWYSLADDATSADGERVSRVLITDGNGRPRIRRLWTGDINADAGEDRPDEPAHPTVYRPDPKLKGGLG